MTKFLIKLFSVSIENELLKIKNIGDKIWSFWFNIILISWTFLMDVLTELLDFDSSDLHIETNSTKQFFDISKLRINYLH